MSLCGIWVKADTGRWFDDPEIGGADWRLVIDEFDDDYLYVKVRKAATSGRLVPVIDIEQLVRETHLPIVLQRNVGGLHCVKVSHDSLGRCFAYRVAQYTGLPFPRRVIMSVGDGHERRGQQGTFVGGQ